MSKFIVQTADELHLTVRDLKAEVERLEALSVKSYAVLDKLRWVSQEARAVIMLGYTGPNHEKLRKALAQLTVTQDEP